MTSGEKAARTRQANQLKLVAQWNALFPVGTPVTVQMDSGDVWYATTRSPAQMLGAESARKDPGHTAVIWLDGKGIEGCYALSRVRPREVCPMPDELQGVYRRSRSTWTASICCSVIHIPVCGPGATA